MRRVCYVVAVLFLICLFPGCASASPSRLDAVEVFQSGDSRIVLRLTGNLPGVPAVECGVKKTVLTLKGTSFPAVCFEKDTSSALVPHISVRETESGCKVILNTSRRLSFRKVRGEGTDTLSLMFRRHVERSVKSEKEMKNASRVPRFMSKRISLSLCNGTVDEALEMLAHAAELNLVVVADVARERQCSFFFKDTEWGDVLNYVVRTSDLDYSFAGKTLVVAPRGSDVFLKGHLSVKKYSVAYADTVYVAEKLKELVGLSSRRNAIIADPRTFSLIVKGDEKQHARVAKALKMLDAPGNQVAIRAKIIELNENAERELQGELDAFRRNFLGSYRDGVFTLGYKEGIPEVEALERAVHFLNIRLRSLVERKDAKVLASPDVSVLSGEKAKIILADRQKFITQRDDAGNPSFETEITGPQLEILPRVGINGMITVDVDLKTGEVTGWLRGGLGEQIPRVSERSVRTTVRLRDGEPFVIGGLFRENNGRVKTGIPFFSRLPLVGHLFTSHSRRRSRSQVIMILIPYVLEIPELAKEPESL